MAQTIVDVLEIYEDEDIISFDDVAEVILNDHTKTDRYKVVFLQTLLSQRFEHEELEAERNKTNLLKLHEQVLSKINDYNVN